MIQLAELLAGTVSAVRIPAGSAPAALLPGSFNPLHDGHLGMAKAAPLPVEFELSVTNADKPPLDERELLRRAAQFAGVAPLWLTRAPTFLDKARLFAGTRFVVGADTAARVVMPRFYSGDEGLADAMAELRQLRCGFLVAGRVSAEEFLTLDQLAIPPEFADLFEPLDFRLDVSSTQLRQADRSG